MKRSWNEQTFHMVQCAFFTAVGILLPVCFHLFGNVGPILLPMHIPVLLCGMFCGTRYGAICGFMSPVLSSLLTGMPALYPVGIIMIAELCVYGAVSGIFKKRIGVYGALFCAMTAGRAVAGMMGIIVYGAFGKPYSLPVFLQSAFVIALPGIILQIILIPLLVFAVERSGKRISDKKLTGE